jgi:hypothetical protein
LDCLYGKVEEKITDGKTHNGCNRDRDVKERYENFMQIIKGKLEETNPKKKRPTLEMEDKEK